MNETIEQLKRKISERRDAEPLDIKEAFAKVAAKTIPNPEYRDKISPEIFSSVKEHNGAIVGIVQKDKGFECYVVPKAENGRLKDECVLLEAQSHDYDCNGAGGRTNIDMPEVSVSVRQYKEGVYENILYFRDELKMTESMKKLTPERLLQYCSERKEFIKGEKGKEFVNNIMSSKKRYLSDMEDKELCESRNFPEFVAAKIANGLKKLKTTRKLKNNLQRGSNDEVKKADDVIAFLQEKAGIKKPSGKEEAVKIAACASLKDMQYK